MKGSDHIMKQRLYYLLANVFYHIVEGNNAIFEYFWNKAEAIAEAKYSKEVTNFYENGIGYYGKE